MRIAETTTGAASTTVTTIEDPDGFVVKLSPVPFGRLYLYQVTGPNGEDYGTYLCGSSRQAIEDASKIIETARTLGKDS